MVYYDNSGPRIRRRVRRRGDAPASPPPWRTVDTPDDEQQPEGELCDHEVDADTCPDCT